MPSVRSFETWAPLLAVMWAIDPGGLAAPGTYVEGQVYARGGWGYTSDAQLQRRLTKMVRALAARTGIDPIGLVRDALREEATAGISFVADFFEGGRVVLHLLDFGPAVEVTAGGIGLGSLVLVEDALPELWRRQPTPSPRARPAASADPKLLKRTLRGRLPGVTGATDAEIAAAEDRLGIPVPEELKALYRVVGARPGDGIDDGQAAELVATAVGCYLLPLDDLYMATAATRPLPWIYASQEAAYTSPSGAVQALVGSPGWLVFGGNGGGDRVAVDLTPGPRGNVGQVIMIWHEERYGAGLFSRSLTDLVMGKRKTRRGGSPGGMPAVARVNRAAVRSIEAAAGPDLEVLSIGVWEDEPLSLAPVVGLPGLRTLTALPGTLADPLEVAELSGLEFLELGPQEWRVLIDAGAVPRGLLAAGVESSNRRDPLPLVAIANELLTLWDRPRIAQTTLEGNL